MLPGRRRVPKQQLHDVSTFASSLTPCIGHTRAIAAPRPFLTSPLHAAAPNSSKLCQSTALLHCTQKRRFTIRVRFLRGLPELAHQQQREQQYYDTFSYQSPMLRIHAMTMVA